MDCEAYPSTSQVDSQGTKHKAGIAYLCEQLQALWNKQHFVDARKDEFREALTVLLGIDGTSPEWSYLNSGTHDDERPEFDRGTVNRIIEGITQLDAAFP